MVSTSAGRHNSPSPLQSFAIAEADKFSLGGFLFLHSLEVLLYHAILPVAMASTVISGADAESMHRELLRFSDMEGGGRPGVLVVGSSGVGKRTLLSRLLSVDFEDSTSQTTEVHDWTINTKYYSADVSVWISHICHDDDFSLPHSHPPLVALVMVFDLTQLSTLVALQDWFSHAADIINSFDILLCIGNKVDLLPHHPAHDEYRRRLLKPTHSSSSTDLLYSDIDDFGISQSEGCSLLGSSDDTSLDIRATCLQWCRDNNIEFIEACASNPDFDKCLSVDGDSQGVERLFGALSAHMWPGMVLKSGDKINEPVLPLGEELSEEESEYELEYEVLSSGSADPWENFDEKWVSASEAHSYADPGGSTSREVENKEVELLSSGTQSQTERAVVTTDEIPLGTEHDKFYELEDVEQLMSEIGNIRDNLRLMPDFQRREIAANLAMKMASMFGGDDSDNEEESE
ncbi:GTP binding protein [Hirschfeldia incana]|nr:GTP binding protein [Hirschfeldia incana]